MQDQNLQDDLLLVLYFILEISPALNNLHQTLKIVTVQKELIETNLTAIHDDLRGIERGWHLFNSLKLLLLPAFLSLTSLYLCML